jgi:hypothetical protein
MSLRREAVDALGSFVQAYPGIAVAAILTGLATVSFELSPTVRVVAAPVGYAGALATVLLLVDHALVRFVDDVFFRPDDRLGDVGADALRGFTSVASAALFVALGQSFQSVVTLAGVVAALLYVLVGRHGSDLQLWPVTVFGVPICLLGFTGILEITLTATFTDIQYASLAALAVLAALLAGCWERYGRPD